MGEGLSPRQRDFAAEELSAPLMPLDKGEWSPTQGVPEPGHLGYLVEEGLLVRRVLVGTGSSVELLGRGDILCPWEEEISSFASASWEILEPSTLLVLGPSFAERAGRWPVILSNLIARGTRRSRALAADAALASVVGIEDRVLMLLWQIAERWGEVTPAGVRITIRLPHRVVAELVGARRPSVTTAIAALHDSGRLAEAADDSWILLGDPPS
jgi:CRP-like cAMP-binding protein